MKQPKAEKLFATEAANCAAFIATIDADRWAVYPETCGWDILLSRRADGFQIGIQAKLRLNTDVINQALDEYGSWSQRAAGPDCRALLVPSSNGFARICGYLALVVLQPHGFHPNGDRSFDPALPRPPSESPWGNDNWPEWAPAKRHKLPDYVPDVIAGASSPVQLTDWKIRALKVSILLARRGFVVRPDFAHINLDMRRWVEGGWLQRDGDRFIKGPKWPGFDKQHPKVLKEIEADYALWAPAEREAAKQVPLL